MSTTAAGIISLPASSTEQMRIRADLPDAVCGALLPHEQVIWAQRGNGCRWPLAYLAGPLLHIVLVAFAAYMFGNTPNATASGQLFMPLCLAILLAIMLVLHARVIFGPASETYVLTNLRMIHCNAFLAPVVRSLTQTSVTGEQEFLITRVAAWGRRERGWLMLRADEARSAPFSFILHPAITSLVGIDRPLELAALVKETLKLDFEIEDHTRP